MKKKLLLLFLAAAGGYPLAAQQLAHSDILMFSMTAGADSIWHAGSPRFLTVFNRQGYNNQPNFFSDNDLYLTIQRPADTTQTDIYSLDLAGRTCTQVTQTNTSEYSPTLMFGGQRFSVVEVDMNGIQRLVSYPFDRSDNGRVEFSQITGVGYHCWLRDTLAALFIVGQTEKDPHILYVAGTRNQKLQRITANPGRCLLPLAGGKLA
ncbi:MAG: hypothetical protein ABIO24_07575, partial [Saprospiraceae bacterium]